MLGSGSINAPTTNATQLRFWGDDSVASLYITEFQASGTFTLYDNDGTTVLYTTSAWADAAGTVPYSGGALRRIDALF